MPFEHDQKCHLIIIIITILILLLLLLLPLLLITIIIMYIYNVLINALSAHMIYINLNLIFYTHVEHSPNNNNNTTTAATTTTNNNNNVHLSCAHQRPERDDLH